jgi:nitroimidazol reductase NimA-like FMN-containing flavoprotein (pyridoxamine 5'-phosphate oxidase superfamily)
MNLPSPVEATEIEAAEVEAAPGAAPDAPRRGQLRRADKIMTSEEIDAFLAGAFCGRTATIGADGYPYVVPNLFVWARGLVYLHTAKLEGHFLANVRHCDRASFEIDEAGEVWAYGPVECDTTISYRSVILFGRIREIDAAAEKMEFYSRFMRKYAPTDSWGREVGSFPRMHKTIVYAITPEAVTGKQGPLPPLAERWPHKRAPAVAVPDASAGVPST